MSHPLSIPSSWKRPLATTLAILLALPIAGTLTACQRSDAAALLAEARAYHGRGDTQAALIQLKNALKEEGSNRHARLLLGEVYLDHGDPVLAERELRRARAVGADPARYALLLGKSLLMQGHYEQLLDEIVPHPNSANRAAVLTLRADALAALAKPEEARAIYLQALALQPALPEALIGLARLALASDKRSEARSLTERALAQHPDTVETLRFHADLLRAEGRPDAALAAHARITALRPRHPQAWVDMANLHVEAGRLADARAAIAQARKAAGPTLAVVYAEALIAFRENKHAAALDALQRILSTAPDYHPAILLAAAVQSAQGATQQASQHLQRFLAAYPGHLYASKLMSTLKVRAGDTEAALALLHPLMRAHPADVELLTLAGEAHLHARQFGLAADLFERAGTLRPSTVGLHTALALSRLGNGEHARAVAELERAAALDRRAARTGILLVMTQLRAKAPDKALAAVIEMEKHGNNPLVQNLKGGVLLAQKDEAGARACFDQALALEPLYLPALANLAQLDLRQNKPGQARKRYESALQKDPRNAALMQALANLALGQGQAGSALAWFERAYRLEPDSLALGLRIADLTARTGAPGKALSLARALRTAHPASPEALALLAQAQVLNRDPRAALDSYARLAAMAPRSTAPHVRSATLLLAQQEPVAAMAALRKALAIDPDLFDAQLSLMNLLIERNEFAQAQALAAEAQRRQPRAPNGYKLEGDLLWAQQRHAAALAAWERAFALQPTGALLVQMHTALTRLGRTGEADARAALWFGQHPDDVPTRLYYASSKLVRREHQAAIGHLEAVLVAEPNNVVALNDLAWACQQTGDPRALSYAERAYALAPASPTIMDTLGWILFDTGKLARALPLLQKATALAPQANEIRFHLGMVLARAGDKRGARRELEKVLASPHQFARRQEVAALLASL